MRWVGRGGEEEGGDEKSQLNPLTLFYRNQIEHGLYLHVWPCRCGQLCRNIPRGERLTLINPNPSIRFISVVVKSREDERSRVSSSLTSHPTMVPNTNTTNTTIVRYATARANVCSRTPQELPVHHSSLSEVFIISNKQEYLRISDDGIKSISTRTSTISTPSYSYEYVELFGCSPGLQEGRVVVSICGKRELMLCFLSFFDHLNYYFFLLSFLASCFTR